MAYPREAFGTLGETSVIEGRSIRAGDVRDADILAIRSTTKVGRDLLEGSSIKFVGTATTGMDHLDTVYLDSAGIRWCYSPGCNANSVAEYIIAALLCLANRHGFMLAGKTIGVIGVGNVGGLVCTKAESLGMRILRNDPPIQRSEAGGQKSDKKGEGPAPGHFISLDRLLAEADIVTMHVPLTREGPDKTFHMANEAFFTVLKQGCIFLNSARGAVVDTNALLTALHKGIVSHAVIDTWEGEPAYRRDLLDRIDLGTPHIAGYSFDGKVMGTVMVYKEACRFRGMEPSWVPDDLLPQPVVPKLEIVAKHSNEEKVIWDIVRQVYDIESDDDHLRCGPDDSSCTDYTAHFDNLRGNYPIRREFSFTRVNLETVPSGLATKISGLGFVN